MRIQKVGPCHLLIKNIRNWKTYRQFCWGALFWESSMGRSAIVFINIYQVLCWLFRPVQILWLHSTHGQKITIILWLPLLQTKATETKTFRIILTNSMPSLANMSLEKSTHHLLMPVSNSNAPLCSWLCSKTKRLNLDPLQTTRLYCLLPRREKKVKSISQMPRLNRPMDIIKIKNQQIGVPIKKVSSAGSSKRRQTNLRVGLVSVMSLSRWLIYKALNQS